MKSYLFILASLATAVWAESTEIQVFDAGATAIPLSGDVVVGSIVAVKDQTTTVAVSCNTNVDSCPLQSPFTITQGPSTVSMSVAVTITVSGIEATVTIVEACKITSSTQGAECVASEFITASSDGFAFATTSSTSLSYPSSEIQYQSLLITAGAEKLPASSTVTVTEPSSTATETSKTSQTSAGTVTSQATETQKAAQTSSAAMASNQMGLGGAVAAAVAAAAMGFM